MLFLTYNIFLQFHHSYKSCENRSVWGGKIERGEIPEECLQREVKEEFDIVIKAGPFFVENIYKYTDKKIHLSAYFAYI